MTKFPVIGPVSITGDTAAATLRVGEYWCVGGRRWRLVVRIGSPGLRCRGGNGLILY